MGNREDIRVIVATDCGSTTTKAILIKRVDGEYRLIVRGEAPTTVEAPFEDVTRGVLNAIREVEELSGHEVLDGETIIHPHDGANRGVDIYLSTSSAGGGLQMMVAGVVKSMTAESAERAALGAGAIVMDVLASNDGRLPHQQIERIRHLRPDMILLSGGIDGGTITHVVELGQIISAADPRPRLGLGFKLPVIYAGNKDARPEVAKLLEQKTSLFVCDNLRPVLERENLGPAREKIHDLFMEHVMAQAPGYDKLMEWTDAPIMPTPGAVGSIIETIAKQQDIEVVGVDIGGATTDVFSVFKDTFNRTVSANLGMSYSVSNVLAETGVDNVMRWVPFKLPELDVRNRIKNKMIRPTTMPADARGPQGRAGHRPGGPAARLRAAQVVRRQPEGRAAGADDLGRLQPERLRRDPGQHDGPRPPRRVRRRAVARAPAPAGGHDADRRVHARGRHAARRGLDLHDAAARRAGRGPREGRHRGVREGLPHPPRRDSSRPSGRRRRARRASGSRRRSPDGRAVSDDIPFGEMRVYPLAVGETVNAKITPARGFDVGGGPGRVVEATLTGGVVGLMVDARGRPFKLPSDEHQRVEKLTKWAKAFNAYPEN